MCLRAGEPAWNDLCWSATASALSVGHVRAPRSYQIARLLRDAARVRGGLMHAYRVLAGLERVLRLCGGLVMGGGDEGQGTRDGAPRDDVDERRRRRRLQVVQRLLALDDRIEERHLLRARGDSRG